MKKSAFVNLMIGTVGSLLFALGMCMCLLPEWNAFEIGVVCTGCTCGEEWYGVVGNWCP